jgi:hypothetical protein
MAGEQRMRAGGIRMMRVARQLDLARGALTVISQIFVFHFQQPR